MSKIFKRGDALKTSLTVLGSLLLTAGVVVAATTISTNISTGGTLLVTGASTQYGAVSIGATGTTTINTLGQASTTQLSALGPVYFGSTATTTFNANGTASSTALFTLDSLQITSGQGATKGLDTVQAGALSIGGTNATTLTIGRAGQLVTLPGTASSTIVSVVGPLYVGGTATTTFLANGQASSTALFKLDSLQINGGSPGSTIAGIVFGTCDMSAAQTVTATTSISFTCTQTGATTVTTSHKIFLMATSSIPVNFAILSASSTGAGTIGVTVANTGIIAGTSFGPFSFNFMGIR